MRKLEISHLITIVASMMLWFLMSLEIVLFAMSALIYSRKEVIELEEIL